MLTRSRPESGRPAVCIVHHYYYPQHGHVRRDAEALAGAGYDVTVIALQQPGQARHERVNGIDVHRLPLAHRRGSILSYGLEYGRLIGMVFLLLTKLHLQKRFQVIEIDNMPDVLVFSALIPKLMGAKIVLYLFDSMSEIFMLTRGAGPNHPAVRLLVLEERISAAFADRAIVPHHPFRETIHAHGVPREKMTVVLNGPDDAIFTPRLP
ncbi:MAG TPA: glycosyltransferase, partial [Chloroflexota bacterium]|nr:glycosyltransferase [Chloroflexota bacterium]